ncbi:MAG: hypothetical protein KatS3mg114_0296 [Planctomycetaceae bacterium]|nr:MAG: hypothetical protein KatS3mg114_0296 [Planctomycetaceae bacterium]
MDSQETASDHAEVSLGRGRFLALCRRGRWEYADRLGSTGAVAVVAVTPERQLVLTEQERPAVQARVIDLPAGLVGDEDAEEAEEACARRELLEETGFAASALTLLARCPTSPGLSSEIVALYLASPVFREHAGGGVGHEQIVVHTPALDSIWTWLQEQSQRGLLIDIKIYAALAWWLGGMIR